jgi:membrane protein DedA with SNARE-associated domain
VVVASAAAIVGDNIGYLIGRAGGYRPLRRYGRCVRVDEAKLKVGRCLFDGHGGKVLFCRRFVSVLRTYLAFVAGVNLMSWRCFLLCNASGESCRQLRSRPARTSRGQRSTRSAR